jgi:hypothetical protein
MSQEDLEIVMQHVEAFRNGDNERAMSLLHTDVVLDTTRYAAEGETLVGHGGVERFARRFKGAFGEYDYGMTDFRDLGEGMILGIGTERARGRSSGVLVERTLVGLYDVVEREITRITMFGSEVEALEAARLRE